MLNSIQKFVVPKLFALICLLFFLTADLAAMDVVSWRLKGTVVQKEGRVLVQAQDGGLVLETEDGQIWVISPDDKVSQTQNDKHFKSDTQDEVIAGLKTELPAGFQFHKTKNYVIAYNTSKVYAEWAGSLFERLFVAFENYWGDRHKLKLTKPEFPLVAVIFKDKNSYEAFCREEVGNAIGSVIGYYSLTTNRMMMYDLTGLSGNTRSRVTRTSQITSIMSRPQAERTVATIIHEATHQIAYNTGIQTRFADNPVWLSEGMAMYFETPNPRSSRGFPKIGSVNRYQLAQFKKALVNRKSNNLITLLTDDTYMRNTKTAAAAYSEAWALSYFLMKKYPDKYAEYLKLIAKKPRMVWDSKNERLEEFKSVFGEDLSKLEKAFIRYIHLTR